MISVAKVEDVKATLFKESGFSLIELMIAMVLGLLVLGAAIGVFQSNQRTYSANEGLNRVQEAARVAFELMSRDLKAAGGSACSSASFIETNDAYSTTFRDTPVTGTASELTVTSGDDTAHTVIASTVGSVTLATPAAESFAKDDWILICNARKTFLVQVATVSGNMITFDSTKLKGYIPTADEYAPPAAVVVAKLRNTRWYLDGSTLKVSRLGGTGEAVADGVQGLALSYLESGAATYLSTPANPADIIAVRMVLTLEGRSATGGQLQVDGNKVTRTASNVVTLRSRTL